MRIKESRCAECGAVLQRAKTRQGTLRVCRCGFAELQKENEVRGVVDYVQRRDSQQELTLQAKKQE